MTDLRNIHDEQLLQAQAPSAGALGRADYAHREAGARIIVVECCGILAADLYK
jgi:hypothetical protein